MKPRTEEKILKSYLELIDSPDAKERTYRLIAYALFTVGMFCLFYLFSDTMKNSQSYNLVVITAIFSGLCFGLGVWFSQMGSQTRLVTEHLSKTSINNRIDEISTKQDI
jgi:hypothetical protein